MNLKPRLVYRNVLSAVLGLVLFAPTLRADILWAWTYSGISFSGSGSITTESTLTIIGSLTGYRVLDMSGTFDFRPITGLLPVLGFGGNDNLLGPSQPQLDENGLAFTTTADIFNIHFNSAVGGYQVSIPGFTDGPGFFSATAVENEVAEPTTAALVVPMLLAFVLFALRKPKPAQSRFRATA